eukprot:CAMPEP_0174708850 /NCGR_PEP_ID=MMETSP1094-20130205/10991_1 /TAXON_ID=156173 /ORGANISM="Chrysochromulina brevifilum, Strain UTEX LB 985" /LENGTH=32 /DNA_ID= /DNA_START= /DNA_END= /DNA_ORIENTATION=
MVRHIDKPVAKSDQPSFGHIDNEAAHPRHGSA